MAGESARTKIAMDPLTIAVIVTLASTAAMLVRAERRRRAQRRAVQTALVDALRVAAAELGLAEPIKRDPLTHAASGAFHGVRAELTVAGHGYHQVTVGVGASSLPGEITIGARPTGRGIEDFQLGVAGDSGTPRFDAHHALFGSKDALKTHAAKVDVALLELVADHFDPAFHVVVTSTELRLGPGDPTLPWLGSHSLRWPCGPDELVTLWRNAERIVKAGLDRRLLTGPSK